MKFKSILAAFLASAGLLSNGMAWQVFAHPHPAPRTRLQNTRIATSKTVYFNGYCLGLSLQVTSNSEIFGSASGCASTQSVVAGHVSTVEGVPNTMVVSTYIDTLLGKDSAGRRRPIILAIFPDNSFKAYSGPFTAGLSAIDLLVTGAWSTTRTRFGIPLRKQFGSSGSFVFNAVGRSSTRATILRTFTINGYCKVEARITDGIVYAYASGGTFGCNQNLGGVVTSGAAGIPDGTIALHHGYPPGGHVPYVGVDHVHQLLPNNIWKTYHVSKTYFQLSGQGTYWESAAPRNNRSYQLNPRLPVRSPNLPNPGW